MTSKLIWSSLAAAILATTSIAHAADLPAKGAPIYTKAPALVPVFSWTGLYVGGNLGGLWATGNAVISGTAIPVGNQTLSGFLGGAQIGANYQVGSLVVGIQGDYDWSSAKGTNDDLFTLGNTDRTRIRSLASVTGRLGYAMDRSLLYVKGGGAWMRADYDTFITGTGIAVSSASETRSGWTVGGGVEYAFMPNLSVFAEYDYYGLGTRTIAFTTPGGAPAGSFDIKERVSVVKGGFNYLFNVGR